MATNTLHTALCDTLNLFKNLRLRIAIVRSAWRQPNISNHTSTVSCDLVLKIFLNVLFIVNGLMMISAQGTGLQSVKQDWKTFRFYKLYNYLIRRNSTNSLTQHRDQVKQPVFTAIPVPKIVPFLTGRVDGLPIQIVCTYTCNKFCSFGCLNFSFYVHNFTNFANDNVSNG